MNYVGLEWTLIDTWITIGEVSSAPSGGEIISQTIKVYSKDKSGTSALYLMDDAGSEREIAPPNTVTGTGTANRITYWTGTNTVAAGTLLTWDETNKRVGIGTATPSNILEIADTSVASTRGSRVSQYSADSNFANIGAAKSRAAVVGTQTALLADDGILQLVGFGSDGTSFGSGQVAVQFNAGENWSGTNKGTYIKFVTTPNASTTSVERMRINPAGFLGLGNNGNPVAMVDIVTASGLGGSASLNFQRPDGQATFAGYRVTGSATAANEFLAFFGGGGSHTGLKADRAVTSLVGIYAGELWGATAKGSYITLETTPNASVTRAERLRVTDTTLQPGTTLVMNLGTSALRFLRLWGGDVEMADQAAPSAPASGNALLFSFNQQGFSVLHVTDSTNAQIEIARDNYVVAKNTSGVTINKGQAVYITGATGNVPNVAKAKADSLTTLPAVGIMFENTTNNSFGRVMYAGNVENFDTSAFTAGDKLWVSTATAGALTNTRPTPSSTSFPQHIASVLTSGVGNGSIYCNANDVEGVIASDADPLSQYFLLAGRSGGQVAIGGTASADILTLQGSSHSDGGRVIINQDTLVSLIGNHGAVEIFPTISNSAGADGVFGCFVNATFTGSDTAGIGFLGRGTHHESASVNEGTGFFCDVFAGPPTGVTISNLYGGVSRTVYEDTAGAVTTGRSHYIPAPVIFGALKPTNQYGLHIQDQGRAGITTAVGLKIEVPTGSTNNYVFELPADATDPTGGGGAAAGRIPCLIGGALKYIPYY